MQAAAETTVKLLLGYLVQLRLWLPRLPAEMRREAIGFLCEMTGAIRLFVGPPSCAPVALLQEIVGAFQETLQAVDALNLQDQKARDYRDQIAQRLQAFQDAVAWHRTARVETFLTGVRDEYNEEVARRCRAELRGNLLAGELETQQTVLESVLSEVLQPELQAAERQSRQPFTSYPE